MDDAAQMIHSNQTFKENVLTIAGEVIELRRQFSAQCPDLSIDPQKTDRTTERFQNFTAELMKQYSVKQQPALAIYGANNSGKTAFLQHFLQIGKILPSDAGAVTARITKLTYSPAEKAYAHIFSSLEDRLTGREPQMTVELQQFFDNKESPDWDSIRDKLKEHLARPNDSDERNFAEWSKSFIEIGLPSPILRLRIDIYDTPGYLSNNRDEILNQNLYQLLKSVEPTLLFLYDNPAVSETDRKCFISLKEALGSLETIPIFFLNTKADILVILKNGGVKTKEDVPKEKIEKVMMKIF